MLPPCNVRNGFVTLILILVIFIFVFSERVRASRFLFCLYLIQKENNIKTMAAAAKIPTENDFLEELDSYGCGLGIPSLIHAQAYFIRFVLQNKVALGYTDDFANELITGASFAIDIFVSIDNRIQTNLV